MGRNGKITLALDKQIYCLCKQIIFIKKIKAFQLLCKTQFQSKKETELLKGKFPNWIPWKTNQLQEKAPPQQSNQLRFQIEIGKNICHVMSRNPYISKSPQSSQLKVMQFGRIDANAYTLDFQYPLTAIQVRLSLWCIENSNSNIPNSFAGVLCGIGKCDPKIEVNNFSRHSSSPTFLPDPYFQKILLYPLPSPVPSSYSPNPVSPLYQSCFLPAQSSSLFSETNLLLRIFRRSP